MKKIFKYLVPFLLIGFIACPAFATMQEGGAGNISTRDDFSGAVLMDQGFSPDPLWSTTTSSGSADCTVINSVSICTLPPNTVGAAGRATGDLPSPQTEVWSIYKMKYDSVVLGASQNITGGGLEGANFKTRLRLGIIEELGIKKFRIGYGNDAESVTDTVIDSPTFVEGKEHLIRMYWRRATAPGSNDGNILVWIDGDIVFAITNADTDTLFVDGFAAGSFFRSTNASAIIATDEVRVSDWGVELSILVPDIGAGYTQETNTTGGATIIQNIPALNAIAPDVNAFGSQIIYSLNSIPNSADYGMRAELKGVSNDVDDFFYVGCRYTPGGEDGYWFQMTGSSANTPVLGKNVSGVWTVLDTGSSGDLPAVGSSVEIRCDGSDISGWINGVQIVSATDSSHTAIGKAAMAWGNIAGVAGDDVVVNWLVGPIQVHQLN